MYNLMCWYFYKHFPQKQTDQLVMLIIIIFVCDLKCFYVIPFWLATKPHLAPLSFAGQSGHLRTATSHLFCAHTSVISLTRLTFKPHAAAMARHEMRSWLCSSLHVIRPFWEICPFFLACFLLHNPLLDNYRSPFFTNEVKRSSTH